jgi:cytochrome oxidase Cu insertion factor (SCO1/SenC/PrrC family)
VQVVGNANAKVSAERASQRATSCASTDPAYKVSFRKIPRPGGDYLIDHAAFTFLLDRSGKYVAFFPPGTPADRMATMVREALDAR